LDLFASSTDLLVLTQPVSNQRQYSLLLLSESCYWVHSNSVVTQKSSGIHNYVEITDQGCSLTFYFCLLDGAHL